MSLLAQRIMFLAVCLVLWETASRLWLDPHLSGRPSTIANLFAASLADPRHWNDVGVTATKMILGLTLGVVTGTLVALFLGMSRTIGDALEPYIVAAYAMPHIALAPLFIVWLGIGTTANTAFVWMTTFFFIFFPVYTGVRQPPASLVRAVQLMGANPLEIAKNVVVPHALVFLVSGLALAIPYSLLAAVGAEMIASTEGIGHQIIRSLEVNDINLIMTSLCFVVLLALALNAGMRSVENWTGKWRA